MYTGGRASKETPSIWNCAKAKIDCYSSRRTSTETVLKLLENSATFETMRENSLSLIMWLEEEGISSASDVIKVESEDPDSPSYLSGGRAKRYVRNFESWVRPPWLARGTPGTVTILQYWINETKQHTLVFCTRCHYHHVTLAFFTCHVNPFGVRL